MVGGAKEPACWARRASPRVMIAGGTSLIGRTTARRVGRLKLVNIRAIVHNGRVAVSRWECQDSPKTTTRNFGNGILVEVIRIVDVAGDGGELNNSWPGRWDRQGQTQWMGSIRIHDTYGDVFVIAIQMMIIKTVIE